jgi:hypothetical protein
MNTLEDRVREALTERAAHSPISADAWDKTVTRSRQRFSFRAASSFRGALPRWLPSGLLIPACAAIAVVAVVLASLALTSGGPAASQGTPPSVGTSSPIPPGVMRADPPFTAILTVSLGSAKLYFWYSHPKNPALCSYLPHSPSGAVTSSCRSLRDVPHGQAASVTGSYESLYFGAVTPRATQVITRLTKSTDILGKLFSGRGFPEKVWLAADPSGASGTIVFSDAAGSQVATIELVPLQTAVPATQRHGIAVDGWTAYLIGQRVLWLGPKNAAVDRTLPWTARQRRPMVFFQATTAVNYAVGDTPADVARLALRFPDDKTYAAPTVTAWPGSGIRLWIATGLPWSGIPSKTVVISYNAAGKIIAEQTIASLLSGNPPAGG